MNKNNHLGPNPLDNVLLNLWLQNVHGDLYELVRVDLNGWQDLHAARADCLREPGFTSKNFQKCRPDRHYH